jgi:glycosyltransferase involved in cell wall biosynthesis
MRLLFVQYAGDYREAAQRFAEGGVETYYAQKYSVEAVAEIGKQIEEVAVICCLTTEVYNEVLPNRVRAIGAGFDKDIKISKLIKLIEEQNPTHLIIRTPIREVFSWAIKNKVPTIATFAQAILTRGLRSKIWNYWLANVLNNNQIEWVGNYGVNACLSLQKIGVNSDKIIPWDFQATETPDEFSPKTLSVNKKTWKLFYIGSLIEPKGVGDILESLVHLRDRNCSVKLKIAGQDKKDFFRDKAKQLQVEEDVEFLGLVPNDTVVPLMREADIILVPSRHEYPEGFPLAISHAFCSRTPLIASDHPMFLKSLKHGTNAMIFPAGNSIALATCIEKLLSDQDLYLNISVASDEAWKQLQMPVKWAELINRWIDDSPENQEWLFAHRLSSGLYDSIFV